MERLYTHHCTRYVGQCAEKQALEYLLQQGLCLVVQNFQCRLGEIDLIMRDKNTLVFIEVRQRKRCGYGGGIDSVTSTKQRKIIKVAQHYLQKKQLVDKLPCRFDVIGIDIGPQQEKEEVLWIRNAFEVT